MNAKIFGFSHVHLLALLAITLILTGGARAGPKYRIIHTFTGGLDGAGGTGGNTLDSAGNLYAVSGGGKYQSGVALRLSPSGGKWKETVLYNFCSEGGRNCTDGAGPRGPLAFDQAGNLYGGTEWGGNNDNDRGLVFQLSPGSGGWKENVIYQPGSWGFVLDSSSNLYGMFGGGTYGAIGELSPGSSGWTYTELYSFTLHQWPPPNNPLIFDRSGNLYGVDGSDAFELSPPSSEWTYQALHHFPAFQGDGWNPWQSPWPGLVFDGSGNLYGATTNGGIYRSPWCNTGCGIVFKLTPQGHGKWKETILHRFAKFADGIQPTGTLVLDQSGNIYGTTTAGGIGGGNNLCLGGGCGTVFKLSPDANGKWTYTVLHRFNGNDGAFPFDGLVMDKQGHGYGDTVGGGKYGYGVIFQITP